MRWGEGWCGSELSDHRGRGDGHPFLIGEAARFGVEQVAGRGGQFESITAQSLQDPFDRVAIAVGELSRGVEQGQDDY